MIVRTQISAGTALN